MPVLALKRFLPGWKNILFAVLAAALLILSFPDFEFWFLAWFALIPLMWAIDRERGSTIRCFALGWVFGFLFFTGTCWWLTYAPIRYAGFPWPLAYFLLFCVTALVGLFPALFAAILSVFLRRFGSLAFLAAPFVWVFTEFLRYWLTGNNWNAIGYSQAFALPWPAACGGVILVSFICLLINSAIFTCLMNRTDVVAFARRSWVMAIIGLAGLVVIVYPFGFALLMEDGRPKPPQIAKVIAIQPNVPMEGLDSQKWDQLRPRQIDAAESELKKISEPSTTSSEHALVVLPESPMNFMYEDDREFSSYINDFARRNTVSVLFNSAEPDIATGRYFNSAVLVGPDGRKAAEYDKIFLLPFGEAVPGPFAGIVPAFVGTFAYGNKYSLIPVGDAKAGVMICFESHFGELSREYVRKGADVIIEMTNDGYLGPTPVLRQHLANAVFRAVETSRPVLRVTNVGITAYITEKGEVVNPAPTYTEATRVWSVAKSDGSQTFYVKYGDWFAWLCSIVTLGLVIVVLAARRKTVAITDS